mmetsp:Transcript_86787/g.232613  ORF Transcript_86787/g.232613 Transcript_86787/m.232613 type:complete len:403 (-) Transcript_86787:16-1224(-)
MALECISSILEVTSTVNELLEWVADREQAASDLRESVTSLGGTLRRIATTQSQAVISACQNRAFPMLLEHLQECQEFLKDLESRKSQQTGIHSTIRSRFQIAVEVLGAKSGAVGESFGLPADILAEINRRNDRLQRLTTLMQTAMSFSQSTTGSSSDLSDVSPGTRFEPPGKRFKVDGMIENGVLDPAFDCPAPDLSGMELSPQSLDVAADLAPCRSGESPLETVGDVGTLTLPDFGPGEDTTFCAPEQEVCCLKPIAQGDNAAEVMAGMEVIRFTRSGIQTWEFEVGRSNVDAMKAKDLHIGQPKRPLRLFLSRIHFCVLAHPSEERLGTYSFTVKSSSARCIYVREKRDPAGTWKAVGKGGPPHAVHPGDAIGVIMHPPPEQSPDSKCILGFQFHSDNSV